MLLPVGLQCKEDDLSPKTILKYEQALQSGGGFFVILESRISQTLSVETLVGTRQSGAELSWTKDY